MNKITDPFTNKEFDFVDPFAEQEDKGGLGKAFGAGVDKLQELGYRAVKGFTNTGNDGDGIIEKEGPVAEWAQEGIDRNIEDQTAYEPTVKSYKDVGSFGDAASYAGELVANSLPYMAGAVTPIGATAMAGGLSQEAYEAQPEDEKNALRATSSGVGQMALERLGIKGSLGQIGKDILKDGVITTAKRYGKGEFADIMKDPSTVLNFSKRVLKGALWEGATEGMQESLAMWGAGKDLNEFNMLDHNKNNDDFLGSDGQRLMESFVGGATVGGVIRTGSESAQKLISWQKQSAPIAKNGIEELVKQGVTQDEAIEQVRSQLVTSAMKQGLSEAEAAAAAARTMKMEYDIDHEIFTPIANDVASRRAAMNERLNQQRIEGGIGDVQNALNNNDVSPTADELVQQQMQNNDPAFFEQLSEQEATVAEKTTVQAETEVNKVTKEEYNLPLTENTSISEKDLQNESKIIDPLTEGLPVEQATTKGKGKINNLDIIESPLSELSLSEEVPQFKSGANEKGVVEPLGGKFDRTGVSPIQVWVRKDGRKEVISGRHRTELAQRSGEQTIPAQYHYEENGFDKYQAAALDAILNVREGQGKVKDYVDFIKHTGLTEAEANEQGILARATGKRAYTIASQGSDTLIAAHRNNGITDEAAVRISKAAPNDEALQAVGIKAIDDGKTIAVAENMVKAVKSFGNDQQQGSGDLFGFDDSAMIEAENLAKAASKRQAEIQRSLSAIQGAAKRPDLAKKEGVNVKDPKAVNQRIEQLKEEKRQWDNWHTNPKLVDELTGIEPEPIKQETPTQTASQEVVFISEPKEKKLDGYSKADHKGRKWTYFEATKEKDGVKVTSFSFNRSDKDSGQRNKAGLDASKILNSKGYEIDPDYIPKGAIASKVFEIREGENNTVATVLFKTLDGDTFEDEVKLSKVNQSQSVDEAAHEAATSPKNDLAEPTIAQAEANNYKLGRIEHSGFKIGIENPEGSYRKGIDSDGKEWSNKINHHYGDITGTKGADGDALDVFVKPGTESSDHVYIVNQKNRDGSFDEHKVMLGFDSSYDATEAYYSNYDKEWQSLDHDFARVTTENFKEWLKTGDTTQPYTKQPVAKPEVSIKEGDVYSVNGEFIRVEQDVIEGDKSNVLVTKNENMLSERKVKMQRKAFDKFIAEAKAETAEITPEEKVINSMHEKAKVDKPSDSRVVNDSDVTPEIINAARIAMGGKNGMIATKVRDAISGIYSRTMAIGIGSNKDTFDSIFQEETSKLDSITLDALNDVLEQVKAQIVNEAELKSTSTEPKTTKLFGEKGWEYEKQSKSNSDRATEYEIEALEKANPEYKYNYTDGGLGTVNTIYKKKKLPTEIKQQSTGYGEGIERIQHTTAKGKELTGIVDNSLSRAEAKAIDPYSFRKGKLGWFIREDRIDEYNEKNSPAEVVEEAVKVEPVIEQQPKNTGTLSDHILTLFQSDTAIPKNATQMKKLIAEFNGIPLKDVTKAMEKTAQESFEAATVKYAQVIAKTGNTKEIVDKLTSLYEQQPNLNMKSATSVKNMAYSTPAPISYLVNKAIGIDNNTTVFEPTAGNGLLLVNNNIDKTTVNELESIRLSNLKWLGYNKVTDKDATDNVVADKSQDIVIMNPPFGNYGQTVDFMGNDGYTYGLKDIDHIIAAKQLDAMKDDGNAALILGANKDAGLTKKGKTGVFLNWLYQNYNVVDHVELDGKVYSRQGAEWPIRIITIHGRNKEGQGKYAPVDGEVTRITGSNAKEIIGGLHERYSQNGLLDTKYGQSERATTSNDSIPVTSKQQDNGSVDTIGSDKQTLRPTTKPIKSGSDAVDRSVRNDNNQSNDGQDGDSGRVSDSSVGDSSAAKSEQRKPATKSESNADESPRDNGVQRKSNTQSILRDLASTSNDNSFQSNYVTGSKGFNEGVLIPVNMATQVQKALTKLIKKHGDIDEYIQDKLNYNSYTEVKDAFMGLQVDGIAMAIDKIENKKAIIIADQTGVGKGRQAAAIVRYAIEQGKTPVFITQKANLFSDMYGDLKDIGSDNVVPFIFNDSESVTYQGKNYFKNKGSERKDGINALAKGDMPKGSNAIFLTYSQINSGGIQQSALAKIAKNAVFILDESHTGAGAESNTGNFLRDLLPQSSGALYLSATYAKRPDQLGLYRLTSLGDAAENMEQLQDAINNGGLQLQTLLSSMLSEEGELVRRERSFDGISVNTKVDKENSTAHEKIYDEVVTHLQDILTLSRSFKRDVKDMNKQNADRQLVANGTVDKMNPFSFASVVHNYISQLTIAIKADSAAQSAIDAITQGKKPVIALESTLESKLESYMKRYAVSVGDSADGFSFTDILNDALTNAISLSVKLPNGKTEKVQQSLSNLSPRTRMLYKQIQGKLDQSKIDLPISPIDHIRQKITEAGYSVEEVTGRSKMVDYSDNMKIVNKHQSENKANRRKVVDRFNAGKTDVLILNQSGSTGLSIHSSEKFQDKRPRHMIVAQPSLDINTFMQMLGRINRTGQVNKPSYDLLWLDLPSENRPAAVLSNKLKGLNANTSANTDSANNVESMDMFNSYGDMVVVEYLEENPELLNELGVAIPEYDIAQFITGKLAVLPVTKQREFFDEIEPRYNDYVNYLKSVGDYHLDTPETDLDARPLEQNILDKGKNTNTFTGDVKLTKVDAKSQGRSPSADDVEQAYQKADTSKGGKLVDQYTDEFNNYINKQYSDKIAVIEQKEVKHKDTEKLKELQESKQSSIDELIEKRNKNIAKMRDTADKIRRTYIEGKSILLSINDEKIHGLIVEVSHKHNGKGDPFSASKFKVKVMTASGLGTLNLSLTQVDSLADTVGNISTSHLKNIFKVEHNKPQRETRHIITGNLVKAYTMIKGGNIVSFTKSGGGSDIGILMPKSFKAEKDIEKPTYVTKFPQLIKYLKSVDSATQSLGVRNSDEFGISIVKGELTVSIPVNNAPTRAKYLSEDIEKILKEEVFWRKGQKVAYVKINEKQGLALFNHVKAISPFSVKDSDAEKFNEVNALKDPSKEKLTKGIRFSADQSIRVAPNKVTLAQAQKIATDFKAEYNGNIPLEFKVVEKQEHLYGPENTVEKIGLIKGGYHSNSEILGIASISQSSVQDTRRTLQHEILGHYGLNTFKPNDKKAILQRIINSKDNPALKKVWVDVEKNYSNLDQIGQAEEVFAAIAENPPTKTGFWGGLVVMLRKAMRAIGIFKGEISKAEVESYIKSIAKGIKSGKAQQQTFPKTDQEQFRREGGGINAPDETRKDAVIRKVQDKLRRLKVIQRVLNVTEGNNAYVAEEAYHGKVSEDLRKMGKQFTDKIADLMAKHELSQDEVDLYLIAKHAQERNAYIDTINPELDGAGSGMSNEAAQAILDKALLENKRLALEEIANKTYAMLSHARSTMVEYGLESQDAIDSWQEQYQYYVPLKGYSVDEGKLNDKGKKFGTGKGFNIKGRETIKAMGRRSLAESPLLHAIADTTQSIIRARKNEVGNVFLKLVNENPDRDFWEVFTAEKPDSKKGFKLVDGVKTVTQIPMTAFEMKASDDYYKTKVDGDEHFIKIEDPLLLRAMGNLGVDEVNIVTASLGKFTRLLSALVTAWNPEFMLTNASRDIQAAIANMLAETQVADGKALNTEGLAFKMVKSIPKALTVLKHGFRNDNFTDQEWGPYLTEFLESGAKTGWVNQQDIEGLGKELKNTIAMASNTAIGKTRKAGKAIADFVYDYNDIVENAARFSAYYHARKQGVSVKQASSLAKNLTINFNRKGEIGNTLNAFYMFANASVQGTANMLRAVATPKDRSKSMWNPDFYNTSQKLAVAAVGTTVVMANLMRMIGGDDDDGIPLYDKIPDFIKATNFIMLTGGKDENGDVNYIAIPMPYGYNIFANMGHAIDGATQGKSIAGQAGHLLLSAASAFSPIGMQESESVAKGLLKTASPTFLKPIAELAVNENFFGSNIYPEQRGYGASKADAHLGNAYTWEWTKGLTTWLNDNTGGTTFKSGTIDIAPQSIDHMIKFMGGGVLQFAARWQNLAIKASNGEDIKPGDIPFSRRFFKQLNPKAAIGEFYDDKDILNDYVADLKLLHGSEKTIYYKTNKAQLQLANYSNGIEKALRLLNDRKRSIEASKLSKEDKTEKIRLIDDRKIELTMRFSKKKQELGLKNL